MASGAVFSLKVDSQIKIRPDGEPYLCITPSEYLPGRNVAKGTVTVTHRGPFRCVDNEGSAPPFYAYQPVRKEETAEKKAEPEKANDNKADDKKPKEPLPPLTTIYYRYSGWEHAFPELGVTEALNAFQASHKEEINGYEMDAQLVHSALPDFRALFIEMLHDTGDQLCRSVDGDSQQCNLRTGFEIHVRLLGTSDNLADRERVLKLMGIYVEAYTATPGTAAAAELISLRAPGPPVFAKQ